MKIILLRLFYILLLTFFLSACAIQQKPILVAHRAGGVDSPENTLLAIQQSLKNNVDAVWITVQLSKDNIPVLYRPVSLEALTNGHGSVSQYTAKQLAIFDAAYYFMPPTYPERGKGIGIPSLDTVLQDYPDTFFYLDIKSPDATPENMVQAIEAVVKQHSAYERVRVYSTESKYIEALPATLARFETRHATRTALANIMLAQHCTIAANSQHWHGFELKREVTLSEQFTLGAGYSPSLLIWNQAASDCFIGKGKSHLLLIGIDSKEAYQKARRLGATAVMVDSPKQAQDWVHTP